MGVMGVWDKSDLNGALFVWAIFKKGIQGGLPQNVANAPVDLTDGALYGANAAEGAGNRMVTGTLGEVKGIIQSVHQLGQGDVGGGPT